MRDRRLDTEALKTEEGTMRLIADLHIHSHYSIATSRQLIPEHLDYWARKKGITIVGTGDITHPGWLEELKEKLVPAEEGLYTLREELRISDEYMPSVISSSTVRFLLTGEISNIYKKDGKTRKVHNLVLLPDIAAAEKVQQKLDRIGNIASDGRPILGLDSRDLLEIILSVHDDAALIPAHIWTPWFSALGSKSGFDTIEQCYGDLTDHIFAVETGLSSDPPMNWTCKFLDPYSIISNSDAHSPEKLGREATLVDTELSYPGIIHALKSGKDGLVFGTVEFFPQEGKYHYDGHRKCGICWDPLITLRHGGICPVCGNNVTVGVMNRVAQLADRDSIEERENRFPFYSLIPLKELLAEVLQVGPNSKKVNAFYHNLLQKTGSEFRLLIEMSIEEIAACAGELLAEAIRRMRAREVHIREGYDGEYGEVKAFLREEIHSSHKQRTMLFDEDETSPPHKRAAAQQPALTPPPAKRLLISFDIEAFRRAQARGEPFAGVTGAGTTNNSRRFPKKDKTQPTLFSGSDVLFYDLNEEQRQAVRHGGGPALVIAGPGTGKTKTLIHRIAYLLQQQEKSRHPVSTTANTYNRARNKGRILAVTFTNRAASEMNRRIRELLPDSSVTEQVTLSTFHAFGVSVLKEHANVTGRDAHFRILSEEERRHLVHTICRGKSISPTEAERRITNVKQSLLTEERIEDSMERMLFNAYQDQLKAYNGFDFDDCIYETVLVFRRETDILSRYRNTFRHVLVDEYQDINVAQYRLIRLLMPEPDADLYVIGDPDQAIYGFRGADAKFIQEFGNDYPKAVRYQLTKSYRCSSVILKASHQIIRANPEHTGSLLKGMQDGVKLHLSTHGSDKSEAEYIARTIEQMLGGLRFFSFDSDVTDSSEKVESASLRDGVGLDDIAVLVRLSRQLDVIEKACNDHAIPYQRVESGPLIRGKTADAVLRVCSLIAEGGNPLSFDRLMAIGDLPEEKLQEIIRHAPGTNVPSEVIAYAANVLAAQISAPDKTDAKSGPLEHDPEVVFLLEVANRFEGTIDEFLRHTALRSGMDRYQPKSEKITLMTLHASKGLEFPCVFIAGCEEGLLPYSLFPGQSHDIQEERRLFYVGMTRAKTHLYLSRAKRRVLFGKRYTLGQSPFVSDIEDELLELSKREYAPKKREKDPQLPLF